MKLRPDQWEAKITTLYAKHCGIEREDAMMQYLKTAQDLEMYGVNYFEMRNKNGVEMVKKVNSI